MLGASVKDISKLGYQRKSKYSAKIDVLINQYN